MRFKIILLINIFLILTIFAQNKVQIDSLQHQLLLSKIDSSKINILLKISLLYYQKDSSLFYYQKAKDIALKSKEEIKIIQNLENIGSFYEENNDFERALLTYQEALQQSIKCNNKTHIANNYNSIANIYYYQSKFEKALKFYQQALTVNEELKNENSIAGNLGNIGNVLFFQRNYDKALEYYIKTIKIQEQVNDTNGIARSYINIANIYSSKEEYDKALTQYQKALNIQKIIDDKNGIALSYTNIGIVNENKGNLQKAIGCYKKALSKNQQINNKLGMAYNYSEIAGLKYKLKDYEQSIIYANKSLKTAQSLGNLYIQKDAYNTLSNNYFKTKQFQQAFDYKDLSVLLKDSIYNTEKSKAIAELQIKYQTEKQTKKILKQANHIKINNLKIAKEKAETEKQEFQRNLFIFGLVVSLVYLFFILRAKKQKQRINHLLEATNKKLIQTNEELNSLLDTIKNQNLLIQEKEELFRTTFNSANDAIVLINNDEQIVLWNKTAEKLFGYLKEEVINKNIHNLITPEKYRKRAHAAFTKYRVTGKGNALNKTVELEGIRKNGEIFPIELSLSSIKIKNKYNAVGIIRDISSRKEQQLKLKELNKQKEILINNIPSAIFYKNLDLRYVEINKNFADLLQIPVANIIGRTNSELTSDNQILGYEDIDKQVIETKKAVLDKIIQHNFEGKDYWISISKIPYFDLDNNIVGVIGVIREITSQIENEKAIKESRNKLEDIYKNITDNINYAKIIQQSLLPNNKMLEELLKDYFLFFKPKGIIGGDFYYVNQINNRLIIAVADCTGHGVSGALLSTLGITFLHDIIKQTLNSGEILDLLREKIKKIFKVFSTNNKNGLDIALCVINTKTNILQYSGAFNPLWIIRNNKLNEYRATRNPIGFYYNENPFDVTEIQLQKNDLLYMFSDGFADQFGGANNSKLKNKKFKALLLSIANRSIQEQGKIIEDAFCNWKENTEQVDDIAVLGFEI